MHIGIIGSGKVGATAARLFVDAGRRVKVLRASAARDLLGDPE
jgi:predicted dinucleotide-binding enzyme